MDANELARMRVDLETLALPDTCTLLSVTRVSDSQGGYTETWGTASAFVPCRLDYYYANNRNSGAALQNYSGYILTVPNSTALSVGMRVELDGVTYSVTEAQPGSWKLIGRYQVNKL